MVIGKTFLEHRIVCVIFPFLPVLNPFSAFINFVIYLPFFFPPFCNLIPVMYYILHLCIFPCTSEILLWGPCTLFVYSGPLAWSNATDFRNCWSVFSRSSCESYIWRNNGRLLFRCLEFIMMSMIAVCIDEYLFRYLRQVVTV